jgi:hypothetical protein
MHLLFYFVITLISVVTQSQTGSFNVVPRGWGVHISNLQLLVNHSRSRQHVIYISQIQIMKYVEKDKFLSFFFLFKYNFLKSFADSMLYLYICHKLCGYNMVLMCFLLSLSIYHVYIYIYIRLKIKPNSVRIRF